MDCVDVCRLAQNFDVAGMKEYAADQLGEHLNTKLKRICVIAYSRAKNALGQGNFIKRLQGGITATYREKGAEGGCEVPYKMLIDFVAAGREAILSDITFQRAIGDDLVPADFIKEVMLTQYLEKYQTDWMGSLVVAPPAFRYQHLVKCAVCGMRGDLNNRRAHYNPWMRDSGSSMITRVCCNHFSADDHNRGEDGKFSWRVFECHKDEYNDEDDELGY